MPFSSLKQPCCARYCHCAAQAFSTNTHSELFRLFLSCLSSRRGGAKFRLSLRELGLGGLRLFQEQHCPNQLVHFISLWLSSCSLVADDQLHMMAILPFRRRKAGFPDFFVSRICWDFLSAGITRHKIHSERSAPRAGFPPHWVSTLSAHRIAVRRSPASAELTRQVEKSTPAAHQILDFAVWQSSRKMSTKFCLWLFPASSRNPAHGRQQYLDTKSCDVILSRAYVSRRFHPLSSRWTWRRCGPPGTISWILWSEVRTSACPWCEAQRSWLRICSKFLLVRSRTEPESAHSPKSGLWT